MPCTRGSPFRRSTCSSNSASVVSAGRRIVSPCMPASSHAFPFERTYTALAGSSPTRTTDRPGVTPSALSLATSFATSCLTRRPIAVPSMSVAPDVGSCAAVAAAPSPCVEFVCVSARKVHRPRFANDHDLDLSGILQLRLDSASDLLGQRRHSNVVDIIRRDEDANLSARLNREHLLDAAVARRDPLETLEPLHVRLEGFTTRTGSRARDGVGRLDEHRDLALMGHVVVVCRNAVHHQRMFTILGRHLDAK